MVRSRLGEGGLKVHCWEANVRKNTRGEASVRGDPEFWRYGYVVRRRALGKDRLISYRRQILAGDTLPGDVLSSPGLGELVTDPAVVSMAGELLGAQPVYFGDSNVSVRSTGRGFHKDNADRYDPGAPDWRDAYPILRIGIYLQDHKRSSGGLNVRDGSNLVPDVRTGRTRYLGTEVGDLVAWNLRTTHSANGAVLRSGIPVAVSPGLAARLPRLFTRYPQGDRVAVFITYGAAGRHLDRYIEYLKTRTYQQAIWDGSAWGPDCHERADLSGLELLAPWEDGVRTADSFEEYQQLPY